MADIPLQFADLGNALSQGAHARYYSTASRIAADEEQRRKDAQAFVGPAMAGDPAAMGQLAAGDPKTAAGITTVLGRMDTNQRARVKDQAEYAANSANAILQADPADRPAVYRQMHAEGVRRGYTMSLPPEYNPSLDGQLRGARAAAIPILNWYTQEQENQRNIYNQNQQNQRHNTPAGGGGQLIDAPSGATPPPQGDATYGTGGAPTNNYAAAGRALSGIETGGQSNPYRALGPVIPGTGDRAFGKYQVRGANIGPWTQEILGRQMTPQEFLNNDAAQEAVFAGKFGQYVQKYGSQQAAARAWFAGEGGMNNPNASDVNGMTVANYERRFNQGLGGGGGGGGPAMGVPGPIATPPAQEPSSVLPPPGGLAMASRTPPMPDMPPQGDSPPQADGSGTPLPPAGEGGQPAGQQAVPPSGSFLTVQPETLGMRPVYEINARGIPVPQVHNGQFVYYDPRTGTVKTGVRYYYNPAQDTALQEKLSTSKRKAENPEAMGPFPTSSIAGTALNLKIKSGALKLDQAADVALGKVVTGADGAQYWISGDQLVTAAGGGARPAPGTPQVQGQPPQVPGQTPATATAPPQAAPAPPQSGGPVQLTPAKVKPTPEAFKKLETEVGSVYKAIDNFMSIVTEAGGGSFDAYINNPRSPEAQKLIGAANALKTALRSEAFVNTGVLQPAENTMLENMLLMPTTFRGMMATPEAYAAMLGEIKKFIDGKMQSARVAHGTEGTAAGNPTKPAGPAQPKAGEVVDGYRFKGGDPSKQENWEATK